MQQKWHIFDINCECKRSKCFTQTLLSFIVTGAKIKEMPIVMPLWQCHFDTRGHTHIHIIIVFFIFVLWCVLRPPTPAHICIRYTHAQTTFVGLLKRTQNQSSLFTIFVKQISNNSRNGKKHLLSSSLLLLFLFVKKKKIAITTKKLPFTKCRPEEKCHILR